MSWSVVDFGPETKSHWSFKRDAAQASRIFFSAAGVEAGFNSSV
jgi:hypothetical protein